MTELLFTVMTLFVADIIHAVVIEQKATTHCSVNPAESDQPIVAYAVRQILKTSVDGLTVNIEVRPKKCKSDCCENELRLESNETALLPILNWYDSAFNEYRS